MFQWLQDLQDGNDLDEVKGSVVQLSDENSSHTLEESSAVHVDRRADGQDETADVLRYTVIFLHTLHHQGQSGRAKKKETRGGVSVCFRTGIPQYFIFNNYREQTSVFVWEVQRSQQQWVHYLELVPKAVARAVKIPQRKVYGFFLVMTK